MKYYYIYCDDGCTQPLACKKLTNGKYVLVRFTVLGFGDVGGPENIISEEFDDIEIYNDFYSPAYFFVKKHDSWGVYRYSLSVDYDNQQVIDFCGRFLLKKEKCCYANLKEIREKYIRVSYEKVDDKSFRRMEMEYTPESWIEKFKKAKEGKSYSELHGLRLDIFQYTKYAIEHHTYRLDDCEITFDSPEESTYYSSEIKLEKSENKYETKILVLNEDCLKTAFDYKDENPIVLNMANRQHPGGGVESGAGAQEECLFRSSNYAEALYPLRNCYPMDRNFGGIYSPSVTIFRGLEDNGYPFLKEPFTVSFVAVAALNNPLVIDEKYAKSVERQGMVNKIRTILGIAAKHDKKVLILGAFGCGAFHNPAKEVAKIFKEELESETFKNRFEKVIFAIKSDHNDTQGNYCKFLEVFK